MSRWNASCCFHRARVRRCMPHTCAISLSETVSSAASWAARRLTSPRFAPSCRNRSDAPGASVCKDSLSITFCSLYSAGPASNRHSPMTGFRIGGAPKVLRRPVEMTRNSCYKFLKTCEFISLDACVSLALAPSVHSFDSAAVRLTRNCSRIGNPLQGRVCSSGVCSFMLAFSAGCYPPYPVGSALAASGLDAQPARTDCTMLPPSQKQFSTCAHGKLGLAKPHFAFLKN